MLQHKLVRIGLGLLVVLGAMLALSVRPQHAYANVTLISFTAHSAIGQPAVVINWETATEIATAGFYVQRSQNVTGPYTQVSPYQAAKGDSITGAMYSWVDETTTLHTAYYYRLEEISTSGGLPVLSEPVAVVAGWAAIYLPAVMQGSPSSH